MKRPASYWPWIAGAAVWTALPLLFVAQTAMWLSYRDQPVNWGELTAFAVADWYSCGIFIPLLIWVTRRWPVDRAHLATRLPAHLLLLAAVSAAKIVVFHPFREMLGRPASSLQQTFAGSFISEIVAFLATAAAIHAIEFYRRYREREQLSRQLQARLTDAQLRALRAQLNPHFLFNTLNAVTTLLHRDPQRADAMLTRLGELLRLTLRADPEHEIPLHEELQLLERYLEIMRMRFPDRVTVTCDADPAVAGALVPSFVLQPLVENAFEHGIAKRSDAGLVRVEATLAPDRSAVILRVRDNGPGPESAAAGNGHHDGVGIANTRRRLDEMYGAAGTLSLDRVDGETVVEVRVPFHSARLVPELVDA